MLRSRYTSLEDCGREWNDDRLCEPVGTGTAGSGGGGGTGGGWYGPRYFWDPSRGGPVMVDANGGQRPLTGTRIGESGSALGTTAHVGQVSRGGFGSLGQLFSRVAG